MKDSSYLKMTMESGSVYEYRHGIIVITPSDGLPKYSIKAWTFFAFDSEELGGVENLMDFLDKVEKKDPAVGLRLYVSGKEEWRISTKIIKLEELNV
jgi:intergrase/recombinase